MTSICDICANYVGCDVKGYVLDCRDFRKIHLSKENVGMREMMNMQKQLQEFLGYDFENLTMEERTKYIKEFYIHTVQELNEAIYELPYFKPWKNYDKMTVEEMAEAVKKYKQEMVDAFHFFMNMMLFVDFTYDELKDMYMEKNRENFERQRRGYDHNVKYREEQHE